MKRAAKCWIVGAGWGLLGMMVAAAALAEESTNPMSWLDNDIYKVSLDMRVRIGLADIDGFEAAQAYTLRTRLGFGFKPWYGFSAFGELENTWSFNDDSYWDVVSTPNGKSAIADPENTELNRAFLQYKRADWAELKLKGGRQRIIFDNARFIGNVGWRQNEQTFDAALAQSSFGVKGLTVQYGYLWKIQRIFGDQGPPATRDSSSKSHVIRANFGGFEIVDITGFALLLDFEQDFPQNSANSYGFRATGSVDLSDELYLKYAGSYAFQHDAARNPLDYEAHYAAAEATLGTKSLGGLSLGYELLSSDDGVARFVTPLATAHKFNGFADAFLNNGGVNGLQDLYLTASPKLPWELKGKVIYHHFWSHHGGTSLGDEIDGVLSRTLNRYLTALTKFAWFEGTDDGPADRWHLSFQFTLKY